MYMYKYTNIYVYSILQYIYIHMYTTYHVQCICKYIIYTHVSLTAPASCLTRLPPAPGSASWVSLSLPRGGTRRIARPGSLAWRDSEISGRPADSPGDPLEVPWKMLVFLGLNADSMGFSMGFFGGDSWLT